MFWLAPKTVRNAYRSGRYVRRTTALYLMLVAVGATGFTEANDATRQSLEREFSRSVLPFLKSHCLECHGAELQEAKLDLSEFTSPQRIARSHAVWEIVLERLQAGEMPPDDADPQPSPAARQAIADWIQAFRKSEATRNAGDPGPVLARRLSNAEYNHTIRDLTGIDMRPTRNFPVDPANTAGFDNSGESLAMSPALLRKYLDAARYVVEHLVLKPDGIAFAPHPVVTHTDRDKYCVKRIIQFYQRQPTDYAEYLLSAWSFQHRDQLGQPQASLDDFAAANDVSPKYLATIWKLLVEPPDKNGPTEDTSAESNSAARQTAANSTNGPIMSLRAKWRALPRDVSRLAEVKQACRQLRDEIVQLRIRLEPTFKDLEVEGNHKGSQPFVLWKNRQYAAHRRRFDPAALTVQRDGEPPHKSPRELIVPADDALRQQHEAQLAQFAATFPDAFYVSERGRDYLGKPKAEQEKGRLLSAGFHSMMGYFRDDGPLMELILSPAEQRELDQLWQELDFITSAPTRQYQGFLWFERTDSRFMRDPVFDFARAEDSSATSAEMIKRLSQVYLAKANDNGGSPVAIKAIEDYFREINLQIRWVEQARLKAEPSQLAAMLEFAARAYRRPLLPDEREGLLGFYRSLRRDDQLEHEAALQDTIVSILMSPHFCYRLDLASADQGRRPLSDVELASRLSYFLWSSMPDPQLLDLAAAGRLNDPQVIKAEAKRMLNSPRVRGLATEFAANWLDIRRFEQHNSVDRERFSEFTDELRQAMFEEPIRFFIDLVQHDRSVLDCLDADHTFVNEVLARHYGILDFSGATGRWQRIDHASRYQRGGLLPMSAFLTQNAPGLRTSPVKRGYWVVRRLLGQKIPPPPPAIPELPADESKLGDLSLREVLAAHRAHASCAGCHDRFDAIGLVLENFGPVGELRQVDLGGRPVDTRAILANGRQLSGLSDLRDYLRQERQEEYLENFCRQLLSYALGRTLLLSDDLLVDEMRLKLAQQHYRFGVLVETIVTSSQFLEKRGRSQVAKD